MRKGQTRSLLAIVEFGAKDVEGDPTPQVFKLVR